jgi:hypothetical protein
MCNLLLLITFVCVLLYALSPPRTVYPFSAHPTIYQGHIAVHLLKEGQPFAPAYMVFEQGEPRFYHLYTNQSIGSYREYTRLHSQKESYASIYTSTPMYKGYSLYRILTQVKPFRPHTAAIRRIYELRKQIWWERCVRNWEQMSK